MNRYTRLRNAKNLGLPETSGWSIESGDYRIKESKIDTHDYLYYRDRKLKIMKYSLYPVVAVTILIIMKVSSMLSNL